jgi:hypothetical protein
VLEEFGDCIGEVTLNGLTRLPRGECNVTMHVRYDENGILQFSATETKSRKSVKATFQTRTEFSDADDARLCSQNGADQIDEAKVAERQYLLAQFELDVERAASHARGNGPLGVTIARCRKWLHDGEAKEAMVIVTEHNNALADFRRLSPKNWPDNWPVHYDYQFARIWPTRPVATGDGSAIIRVVCNSEIPVMYAWVVNVATKEEPVGDFESCRLVRDGKVETVIRVTFPKNGPYHVELRGQWRDRQAAPISNPFGPYFWRFDVSGCRTRRHRLAQVITGRAFAPIDFPDDLKVDPPQSWVVISATVYDCVCHYQGDELAVTARLADDKLGRSRRAELRPRRRKGPWSSQKCTISFPQAGVWELSFLVDSQFKCTQGIVAQAKVQPTPDEKLALFAVP